MSDIWYQKAAAKMAREGKTLFVVSNEMDLGLTTLEANRLMNDTEFARVYRGERFKYYKEIASDPNRSKVSTIGNMMYCADELMKAGHHDKAATVLMNIAKAEGWADATTNVNVFGDLSQKDLDAMKAKVKATMKDVVQ